MWGGILLALLSAVASATPSPDKGNEKSSRSFPNHPGLRFETDGKLSITVFSDLHLGEPGGEQKDLKTIELMKSVLSQEQPDLVVLNGDMISCEFVSSERYNKLVDQIVGPITARNLPFGVTFGNHDWSETCSTISMSEHMWWDIKGTNGQKLSFTTSSVHGPAEEVGVSNYYIPVYSSTDSNKLAMLIWFFDSKGGAAFQPGKNANTPVGNYVHEKVVAWFTKTRDALNEQSGRIIPSIAFVHIPVQATRAFQKSGHINQHTTPGLDADLINHQDNCAGLDCYNHRDHDFMKALVETKGLMAVFSGHDHGIDWCMKWADALQTVPTRGNGVHFCFNRHSGFGGYGNWKRGARQIFIEEYKLGTNDLNTWNRLEDGSISGRVTLNATYGSDWYPKVDSLESSGNEN